MPSVLARPMQVSGSALKATVRKCPFQPSNVNTLEHAVAVKFSVLEPSDITGEITTIIADPMNDTVDERTLIYPTTIMT